MSGLWDPVEEKQHVARLVLEERFTLDEDYEILLDRPADFPLICLFRVRHPRKKARLVKIQMEWLEDTSFEKVKSEIQRHLKSIRQPGSEVWIGYATR